MEPSPAAPQFSFKRFRSVLLPQEHGGWGLLIEAGVLGLVLAPTWRGLCFMLAFFCGFLASQPVLVLVNERGPQAQARRRVARAALLAYPALGAFFLGLSLLGAGKAMGFALLFLLLGGAVQLGAVALRARRNLLVELSGGWSLSAAAPCILLAGGRPAAEAFMVWLLLSLRVAASVIVVRGRLRASRKLPYSRAAIAAVFGAGWILLIACLWRFNMPWVAVSGFLVITIHTALQLRHFDAAVQPRTLGFQQMRLGILNTALIAAGFRVPV